MPTLFDPIRLGAIAAPNRVVMAPLTRNRSPNAIAGEHAAEYYRQRASAGLIVAEASQIDPMGQGYMDTPGIYSDAQVDAWRRVTRAVHDAGGRIALQLWHVGRISHTSLLPGHADPVSSTDRAAQSKTVLKEGYVDVSKPRRLRDDEMPAIVAAYGEAARRARDAGFDGVEIHAANGYLIDQFLRDAINDREGSAWGGSREGRARLLLEAVDACIAAIGADRTGIRVSPITPANDAAQDSDPQGLHEWLGAQLAPKNLAFVHVIEGSTGGPRDLTAQGGPGFDWMRLKRAWGATPYIANNGYTREMALEAVAQGRADAIAFGRPFIANPDLVERLRRDAPLAKFDKNTLYGGGAQGYTDYPTLEAAG